MRSSTVRAKEAINEQVPILVAGMVRSKLELMEKNILSYQDGYCRFFLVKIWKVSNLEKSTGNWTCFFVL